MDVQRTLWLQDKSAEHANSDRRIRRMSCTFSRASQAFRMMNFRTALPAAAEQQGGSKQAEPQQGN
jgi:hypothetical protein